jgi:quinol monooxygenase YgiN
MAIGVIANLKVLPGKGQAFEAVFAELQAAVRANEPENNFYACHRTDDPTVYVVLEQYANQAALTAHGTSAHMKTIGAKLAGIMGGRPEIKTMESIV